MCPLHRRRKSSKRVAYEKKGGLGGPPSVEHEL